MLTAVPGSGREPPSGGLMAPAEPRLTHAAQEFEAQMMKELLGPLNRRSALFEDGGGEDAGVLGEFASESLAGALSARGGLGIANRILDDLSRSGHFPESNAGNRKGAN